MNAGHEPARGRNHSAVADEGGRLVVVSGPGGDLGQWRALVATLGSVLGAAVAVEATTAEPRGARWVDALLEQAARAPGPVLVLPPPAEPPEPAEGEPAEHPVRALRHALAPFDTTPEVSDAVGPVLRALQEHGIRITQLHVPTAETVPAMWEGAGHHAHAWQLELRRRHGVGTASVEVTSGPPALAVAARSAQADLVVLCWKRRWDDGRAAVVRGVLASTGIPVLLLPES